ncbi:MAG: hypothetical protein RMJ84_11080, partial [Sandaracinaceae bacterium]|nr:hypothetical protein [Sandaracinaceae bacterium]
ASRVSAFRIRPNARAALSVGAFPGFLLVSEEQRDGAPSLVLRWFDLSPEAPFALERLAPWPDPQASVMMLPTRQGGRIYWKSGDAIIEREVRVTWSERRVELHLSPEVEILRVPGLLRFRVVEGSRGPIIVYDVDNPSPQRFVRYEGTTISLFGVDAGAAPIDVIELPGRRLVVPSQPESLMVFSMSGMPVASIERLGHLPKDPLFRWNGMPFVFFSPSFITSAYEIGQIREMPASYGVVPLYPLHPIEAEPSAHSMDEMDSQVAFLHGDPHTVIHLLSNRLRDPVMVRIDAPWMRRPFYRTMIRTGAGPVLVLGGEGEEGSAVYVWRCGL